MIKPLTSLRFFFAFFVFLSHISFVKSNNVIYNWLQRNVFFEGYMGVSFFFILSGFVLSYSYKEKFLNKKITRKDFYTARFARIYPLHFLTLIISIPIIYPKESIDVLNLIANVLLLQSFSFDDYHFFSLNPPAWSISDEMLFYLLFPFIIILFQKIKIIKTLFYSLIPIALVISILFTHSQDHKNIFYVNPWIRCFDFILGIILFDIYQNKKQTISFLTYKKATIFEICTLLIFIIFFAFHNYIQRGFRFSIYYWIPMCFIIFTFAMNKGFFSKLLSNSKLVFLGEISFSFYMIHFLIIAIGIKIKNKYLADFNDIILSLICFLTTIALSYIAYIYFEKPINKLLKRKIVTQ